MSKVIVFGGSGFIGSHVADALSDRDYEVTIFDSKPSLYLKQNQNMIEGDIENFELVKDAIKGFKVVFNFAALSDLNDAIDKPIEAINKNILGNCNILEACKENSVERFIYASTVYVNSRAGGFYGLSKRCAESFIQEYRHMYGLNYTILRFGSLYGPRSDQRNGLKKIIKEAVSNSRLKYNGSKKSVREFIHVRDAAKASVNALNDEFKNKKIVLTGHQPIKIIDLLNMLAEMMDLDKGSINFTEEEYLGHYIQTPYHYDSDLAEKYVPTSFIDLGEGLVELIQDCINEK